jgi:hypothetical protein
MIRSLTPQVGWLKASDQTILTLHKKVITHNWRIYVTHDEHRTWYLNCFSLSLSLLCSFSFSFSFSSSFPFPLYVYL